MAESNGLYYMRARYYDPEIGRFISQDPIGFSGGINLYMYANNNPILVIDPNGNDGITITGTVVGAAFVVADMPVAAGIVTGGIIVYSFVQYDKGNMSGSELLVSSTLNILSAGSLNYVPEALANILSFQFAAGGLALDISSTIKSHQASAIKNYQTNARKNQDAPVACH